MKLIYCLACTDVVRLDLTRRTCQCGQSWGQREAAATDAQAAIGGGGCAPLVMLDKLLDAATRHPDQRFPHVITTIVSARRGQGFRYNDRI